MSAASPFTTDYLNHFGELAMLLDMLPEMPDAIDDALRWTPRGYVEHLDRMGALGASFRDAWSCADHGARTRLEDLAASANALGLRIVALLRENGACHASALIETGRVALHDHIRRLSALLRGEGETDAPHLQSDIDALFADSA